MSSRRFRASPIRARRIVAYLEAAFPGMTFTASAVNDTTIVVNFIRADGGAGGTFDIVLLRWGASIWHEHRRFDSALLSAVAFIVGERARPEFEERANLTRYVTFQSDEDCPAHVGARRFPVLYETPQSTEVGVPWRTSSYVLRDGRVVPAFAQKPWARADQHKALQDYVRRTRVHKRFLAQRLEEVTAALKDAERLLAEAGSSQPAPAGA